MSGEASTSPTTILDAPIAPESPTPAVVIPGRLSDDEKAKRRAEWLHEHGAPPNCVLLTVEEIKVLSEAIDEAKRETAAAKESAEKCPDPTAIDKVNASKATLEAERDKLRAELAAARGHIEHEESFALAVAREAD
jgi:hypothetical protein